MDGSNHIEGEKAMEGVEWGTGGGRGAEMSGVKK